MTTAAAANRALPGSAARGGEGLDFTAKLVLAGGTLVAAYLLAAPVALLFIAALRGPPETLPFEPEAVWSLANFSAVYADPVLYQVIVPSTLIFAAGSVALAFTLAFTLAWLIERTDLPGRGGWFAAILMPLLVPTSITAIAWIFLLGPRAGWLNI